MNRRAFTLLETLLGLVLLGALTVAAASWSTGALTLQQRRAETDLSRQGELALKRALRIDLTNDDIRLRAPAGHEHRLWISGGSLHILCRDAGPAEAIYAVDRFGTLVRSVRGIGERRASREHPIAFAVSDLRWNIEAGEAGQTGSVTGRWVDRTGSERVVRFDVPSGWLL